jgi:heme exporter protein CcmD
MDFSSFIAMNGYASYVWSAYGIALIGYGAILAHALSRLQRLRRQENEK